MSADRILRKVQSQMPPLWREEEVDIAALCVSLAALDGLRVGVNVVERKVEVTR